jgi:hypothetical protein
VNTHNTAAPPAPFTHTPKKVYSVIEWQGCTNAGCQATMVTKFFRVASDSCESLVCKLLHVTHLACRILRCFLDFWKFVHSCCTVWLLSETYLKGALDKIVAGKIMAISWPQELVVLVLLYLVKLHMSQTFLGCR